MSSVEMDDSKTRPRIGLEIEKVIDSSEVFIKGKGKIDQKKKTKKKQKSKFLNVALRLVKKTKTRTYSGASRYKLLEIRVFQVSSKQLLQDFLREHQATSARQIQVDWRTSAVVERTQTGRWVRVRVKHHGQHGQIYLDPLTFAVTALKLRDKDHYFDV